MGFIEKKARNRSDEVDGWDSLCCCEPHRKPTEFFFFFFFEREKLLSARALVEYSNDQLDERAPASESTGTEP